MILIGTVWVFAIGTAVWVLLCPTHRLGMKLEVINKNWKACLLLLIPLFYRTILAVLERMKKFPFGMERQEPEEEEKAPTLAPKEDSTEEDG